MFYNYKLLAFSNPLNLFKVSHALSQGFFALTTLTLAATISTKISMDFIPSSLFKKNLNEERALFASFVNTIMGYENLPLVISAEGLKFEALTPLSAFKAQENPIFSLIKDISFEKNGFYPVKSFTTRPLKEIFAQETAHSNKYLLSFKEDKQDVKLTRSSSKTPSSSLSLEAKDQVFKLRSSQSSLEESLALPDYNLSKPGFMLDMGQALFHTALKEFLGDLLKKGPDKCPTPSINFAATEIQLKEHKFSQKTAAENPLEVPPIKAAYKNAMIKAYKRGKLKGGGFKGTPLLPGGGSNNEMSEWLSDDNEEEREELFFNYLLDIDWKDGGKRYNLSPPACAGFTLEKKEAMKESRFRPGHFFKVVVDLHEKYDLPPSLNMHAFDKAIKHAVAARIVRPDESFFN